MQPTLRAATAVLFLAGMAPATRPAHAESFHTCAGFIDSLPATIGTQGVWCMRKDLSTAMAEGSAIVINANNVTIDCNDFKLGGLAAGDATRTVGIYAHGRQNAAIRNCNVRGFFVGASLQGSGHAVLDSRFENNTAEGLYVEGDGLVVRGNRVRDTGGSTHADHPYATAISAIFAYSGMVTDNVVQGVFASADGNANGLYTAMTSGEISRNTVSVLSPGLGGEARGIYSLGSPQLQIRDNMVGASPAVDGIGVACNGSIARDNTVSGVSTPFGSCIDGGGNFYPSP